MTIAISKSSSSFGLKRFIASRCAMASRASTKAKSGVCPRQVEVVEAGLDHEGEGLRPVGALAGHDRDRAELAEHTRRGEHDSVCHAPADGRKRDPPEGLPPAAPGSRPPVPAPCPVPAARAGPRERRTEARRRSSRGSSPPSRRSPSRRASISHSPNQPLAVDEHQGESDHDGETANGRSIAAFRSDLPLNAGAPARARQRRRRSC